MGKIEESGVESLDGDGAPIAPIASSSEQRDILAAPSVDDDDADIPSFLRAEAPEKTRRESEEGRRKMSTGTVLPRPVAQSSLQSSKHSSAASVNSQDTSSTAGIVIVSFFYFLSF